MVGVDEDVDVVEVEVGEEDVDEVAVVGSRLRPTILRIESSSSGIQIRRKMMIRLMRKRMCRGILFVY